MAVFKEVDAYMAAKPGYVSHRLHRSLAPDAKFRFINYVEWETAEQWRAAHHDGFRETRFPTWVVRVLFDPRPLRGCARRPRASRCLVYSLTPPELVSREPVPRPPRGRGPNRELGRRPVGANALALERR
jgi:Antibiotic biosynthesis monooxygenase